VAVLEPVTISGVTIERATLHNLNEMERLGLKYYGDNKHKNWTVNVKRSGDVIPKVLSAVVNGEPAGQATWTINASASTLTCPSCGSVLENDTINGCLRCVSESCPAQIIEQIS
jgi:DNA ligase (NAD+)